MQGYESNVLEQYNIDINSTRKTRGAVLCEADQGVYLLKELVTAEGRIPVLCELQRHLLQQDFVNIDEIILNKEGNYVTELEDGSKYILKRWFAARECDVRKPAEILEASGKLAKLHILMQKQMENSPGQGEELPREYERHNRELKKVRKFIRRQTVKGNFEYEFLKCFDQMYQWADMAEALLEESHYEFLYQDSIKKSAMIHGEYNYHNILIMKEKELDKQMAVTNFDKVKMNIQVEDLYYLLRKVMEKYGWKSRLGDNILNMYSAIKPLTDDEVEYIKIRFIYPEKFWKIANTYFRSNKAWISVKNIQKLETAICQTKEKENFLNHVFSFSPNTLKIR
ncbi:MAG: CotS family spore coat protein [Dorea sp.]